MTETVLTRTPRSNMTPVFNQPLPRPLTRMENIRRHHNITRSFSNTGGRLLSARDPSLESTQARGFSTNKQVQTINGRQYLYMRMMKRTHINTAVLQKIKTQRMPQTDKEKLKQFRRSSAFKYFKKPQEKQETRPSTCQNVAQKLAYFQELTSGCQILRQYKIMSHIGKGAFSVVSLAIDRDTQKNYAIKTYEKIDGLDWNRLAYIKREVLHLSRLQNQRIIRLVNFVRERKKLHLILQNGGKQSLAGLIRKQRNLSQDTARHYFKQIVQGVAYIHQMAICHRDLKPQNILIDQKGDIKLIDFGFSASTKGILNNHCGTPAFMSPQLVKRLPYNGSKVDIWALGVMLYFMLVGVLPFRAGNQQELNRLISNGKYIYRDQRAVSAQSRRFIAKILQVNPQRRPSAQELLQDSWFK